MELYDRIAAAFGGRVTIEQELGGGGMSRVFLAREHSPERQVVIKVLPAELLQGNGAARFRREVDVAGRLQHPLIVPVLDVGEGEDLLAYSMPFIEGQSLRQRLSRGALAVGDATRIWRDMLDALAYAHSQGIIHRDIKPENVLISGRHAMLTDFGVAKAVYEAADAEKMTGTGLALGTPAYMAPEQAMADPRTDHRADLYAAGLVMWEMLAGRHPFEGLTSVQMLAAHATRTPDPIATVRSTTPVVLAALVDACLSKEPADRPASAHALLDAVEAQVNSGENSGARPAAPASGGRAPSRWRRLAAIGAVATAAIAALILGLSQWDSSPETSGGTSTFAPDSALVVVLIPPRPAPNLDEEVVRGLLQVVTSELQNIPRAVAFSPDAALIDVAQRAWGMSAEAIRNPDTLRFLAQRGGSHAFVEFEVARLGEATGFTARIGASRDLAPLGQFTETARSSAEYYDAAQRLARNLRRVLADTLPRLPQSDIVGLASTTVAAAADQIRRGFDRFTRGDLISAAAHFELAVTLDPGFAWGYRQISLAYNNLGIRRHDRLAAITRARELAASARPFEKAMITGLYYSLTELDDSAQAFYLAERRNFPNNGTIANNLSIVLANRREFAAAESWARNSLSTSGRDFIGVAHINLAVAFMSMGRPQAVDSMFAAMPALDSALIGKRIRSLQLASQRRHEEAEQLLARLSTDTSRDARIEGLRRQLPVLAVQGRLDAADSVGRALEQTYADLKSPGNALSTALRLLRLRAVLLPGEGRYGDAYDAILRRYDPRQMPVMDRPFDELAAAALAVGRPNEARRWIDERNRDTPLQYRNIDLLEIRRVESALAASRGDARNAMRWAQAADSGICIACALPTLATAALAAGDSAQAERHLEAYLRATSADRLGVDQFELARALRWLGERAEARGDAETALQRYDELLRLWRRADPALQEWLSPVKTRVEQLRRQRG